MGYPKKRGSFGLRSGQPHREAAPSAELARDLDPALVLLDDLLRDREAEPGSGVAALGGEEGLEDLLEVLGWNAGAVVLDRDLDRAASIDGARVELDPRRWLVCGLAGVDQEV